MAKIYISGRRPLGADFDLLLSGLRSAGLERP